jgi:general nucleoside transport system permease protein
MSASALPRAPRVDWAALLGAIAPFAIALLVGAALLLATGRDPLGVYALMLDQGFGGADALAATLSAATPILFCAVATAISFRAGIFNMGIEGGFFLGGLAGTVAGFSLTGLPGPLLVLIELGIGALTGGVWLAVPGVLRARLLVDEVNHVFLASGAGNSQTPLIDEAGWLPRLLPPSTLSLGFVVALAVLVAYDVWGRYTPLGFEARVSGLNPRFARAVGVDVPGLIVKTTVISGLIAGLAGACHAAGLVHRFVAGFSPGYGFTGLAVVLLGHNTAFGMLLGAVLFGALASAGTTVQLFSDIPIQLVDVLQGTVTVFAVVRLTHLVRRRA